MKKLKILGTGCPTCKILSDRTEEAARALGIEYTLEKVTDLNAIASFGVIATPALVVDGQVKLAGRVPSASAIKALLA